MRNARSLVLLSCALIASSMALGSAEAKNKKQQHHRYVGPHPLSAKVDDGYCYIEVPHVHASAPSPKHKALYRDHGGDSYFIADPQPYGFDGDKHAYYGHHPVAVDVVLGGEPRYESGQQLEYCYLDGPHHHAFDVQPGLTFEVKGGAQWYIGELPAAYVEARPRYAPGNAVYATVEVQRPVVEIDVPPVGYLGPVMEVHLHGHDDHGHGHHGDSHVSGRVGIGVQVEVPTVQIGIGLPGVILVDEHDHGHGHRKHKKYKGFKRHKGRHR